MKPYERLTGVNACQVIQVVEVKSIAGEGTEGSPVHEVTEYYSFEGELLGRRSYKSEPLEKGVWLAPRPDFKEGK